MRQIRLRSSSVLPSREASREASRSSGLHRSTASGGRQRTDYEPVSREQCHRILHRSGIRDSRSVASRRERRARPRTGRRVHQSERLQEVRQDATSFGAGWVSTAVSVPECPARAGTCSGLRRHGRRSPSCVVIGRALCLPVAHRLLPRARSKDMRHPLRGAPGRIRHRTVRASIRVL